MFTGIVQGKKPVLAMALDGGVATLTIAGDEFCEGLELGASVAINGTCLTATTIAEDGRLSFDVIAETLELTNLGTIKPNDIVNVERSMLASDEIGGHRVSGHVFGTAEVTAIETAERNVVMTLAPPAAAMPYILLKGFVALDGASLTISAVNREAGTFSISLIPETLERTTFGALAVGASVNIEVDPQTQAVVDTVRTMLGDPVVRADLLRTLT